ncbi:MAG TPA: response regulator transcription factor, partial [Isoptericola sp.]|nr:response regulator transcription factor [Isoptericola sp.]
MTADPAADGGRDRVRLVLADDQTLVRHGIRSLLEIAGGIDVVAEAEDGATAVDAVREHGPDVLLLDLRMPGRDGIWALETLRDAGAEVAVLVLTTFDDDALVLRALQAGARGYLLKDVTLE